MPDKPRILAVDDDPATLALLKAGLGRGGQYVETEPRAKEAVSHAIGMKADLVFLDMNMPEMSGMSVLKLLRETLPEVPVIVLTASEDMDLAVHAMREGAYHYLVKPVQWEEVFMVIEKAMHHRKILIERRSLEQENIQYQARLEELVAERTAELEKALKRLREAHLGTIVAMAGAIEAKDPYTKGHCKRVHDYAMALGRAVGLNPKQLADLEYGSLLHDIGKIGVSEAVLNKPGKLTDEEYEHIKSHSATGSTIIDQVEYLAQARVVVRHHHERIDGRGYPDGLSGESIPLPARIVAIADTWDAMTSNRPYRQGMDLELAMSRLLEARNTQLDGKLVDLFVEKRLYRICGSELDHLDRDLDHDKLDKLMQKSKTA